MNKSGKNASNSLLSILILVLFLLITNNFDFGVHAKNNLNKVGILFSDIGKLFNFIWQARGKDNNKLVAITAENNQKLVFSFKQDSDFDKIKNQRYFLYLLNTDKVVLVNELKKRVKYLNLPVMVYQSKDKSYMVVSGPYKNLKMARTAKHRLLEQKINSTLVGKRLPTQ